MCHILGMMQANRTEQYEQMRAMLNEKQWRQYLALEAQERGSVMQVAEASQGLTQYGPTWHARTARRRSLHNGSQTACERRGKEKGGREGRAPAGRSGKPAGAQGRPDELAQVDEPCVWLISKEP